MLPIRLGVVAGIAAVSLWGLFSLLDSLKEPGLLRTEKATVVKGCDSPESQDVRDQCATFFCQKALADAQLLPPQARFDILANETYEDDERTISGRISDGTRTITVSCELEGLKVIEAGEADEPAE